MIALAGCAGPLFDGATYRGDGFAFRVGPIPEGWRRIEVTETALAFRDDEHNATIATSARCGVDGEDVPLAALTRHLFLQFREQETEVSEVVPFDGREALHTVLRAKLDGVPKKFDVWVLKKDACVYDAYFIAEPGRFDGGVQGFRRFVEGFATVPSGDEQ